MRAFASTTKTAEYNPAHFFAPGHRSYENEPAQRISSIYSPIIHRKASCACGGGCPACQAKLTDLRVSQPNDPAEIEADQIADRVMRMPVNEEKPVTNTSNLSGTIHRKCDGCEDEEETAQRKALPSGGGIPALSPAHVQNAVSSGGSQLDRQTRSFFESRFQYDIGSVRIHTGGTAADSAHGLRAQAYTLENNIVFNRGKYSPDTDRGRRLLAHELAHVVQQQSRAQRTMIQKMDDATFEANSGVDQGIANGTMTATSIAGQTFRVSCGLNSYDISFRFSKAYKGDYPYQAAGRDVRGVYVKIEASINDRRYCGRCTPMRLLQTAQNVTRSAAGDMVTADPADSTRRTRSGWNDPPNAPSRGWRVDRLTSATETPIIPPVRMAMKVLRPRLPYSGMPPAIGQLQRMPGRSSARAQCARMFHAKDGLQRVCNGDTT